MKEYGKLWKKTAVLMVGVIFAMGIARSAYCGSCLPVNDSYNKAYLTLDEIEELELRAAQSLDLMQISSGDGNDSWLTVFAVIGVIAVLGAILVANQNNDDEDSDS